MSLGNTEAMRKHFFIASFVLLFATTLMGCPKPESGVTPVAAGNGKAVYDSNGCASCHGGGRAPNLSKVGATRDAAWLVAHVKNPKTHNPGSSMPSYEGKINDADLKALGEHLASQK
jgi:cbb3-type cytochrome oxidase cytochrome c subunit